MPKRTNPAAFIVLPCLPALATGAEIHWSIDGSPFTFAATVMIPKGTLLLPAPYPDEGVDPTEDSLGCERS